MNRTRIFISILFLLWSCKSLVASDLTQYIHWEENSHYDHDYENNTLYKTGPSGLTGTIVYAEEYLLPGNDGEAALRIMDVNSGTLLGLSSDNRENDFKQIEFVTYIQGGRINIFENGRLTGRISRINNGDFFDIRIVSGQIGVYVNNKKVYRSNLQLVQKTYLAAALNLTGTSIANAHSTFKRPVEVASRSVIAHLDVGRNRGSISLTPTGGKEPYIVNWNHSSSSSMILTDLDVGTYDFTITDGDSEVFDFSVDILQLLDFQVLTGKASTVDSEHKKIHDGTADYTLLESSQVISRTESSYVKAEVGDRMSEMVISLVDGQNSDYEERWNHGIYLSGGNLYFVDDFSLNSPSLLRDDLGEPIVLKENEVLTLEKKVNFDGSFDLVISTSSFDQKQVAASLTDLFELKVEIKLVSSASSISNVAALIDDKDDFIDLCEEFRNYENVKRYDISGALIEDSRIYYNDKGQIIQEQYKDPSHQTIMASATIYDQFGRPSLWSLDAPLYQENIECYNEDFFNNRFGDPYSYADFDLRALEGLVTGGVYNPDEVENTEYGTLGWFYSDNNTEDAYMPADDHPYSRILYNEGPMDRVYGATQIGENFHAGQRRHSVSFKMPGDKELSFVTNDQKRRLKSVVHNQSTGISSIKYFSSEGYLLADCVSGDSDVETMPTWASFGIRGSKTSYRHMHLPASNDHFYLRSHYTPNFSSADQIEVHIRDVIRDRILIKGEETCSSCDYYILHEEDLTNPERKVVFVNDYSDKERIIKIWFDYHPHQSDTPQAVQLPWHLISHALDYSRWSFFEYDEQGRLLKTHTPNEVIHPDFALEFIDQTEQQLQNNYVYQSVSDERSLFDEVNEQFSVDVILYDQELTEPDTEYLNKWGNIVVTSLGQPIEIDAIDDSEIQELLSNKFGDYFVESPCGYVDIIPGEFATSDYHYFDHVITSFGESEAQNYSHSLPPVSISRNNESSLSREMIDIYDDSDPCDGHCYNGIQDCGEIGVDIGGDCLNPHGNECTGQANAIQFKITTEIRLDGELFSELVLEPILYRTCDCQFYWTHDWANTSLNSEEISDHSQMTITLKEVLAKDPNQVYFYEIDPLNFDHLFGKHLLLKTKVDLHLLKDIPEVDPAEHLSNQDFVYNQIDQVIQVNDKETGNKRIQYNSKRRKRFYQDEQQSQDGYFSYSEYDKHGRIVESGVVKEGHAGVVFDFGDGTDQILEGQESSLNYLDSPLPDSNKEEWVKYRYDIPDPDFIYPSEIYGALEQSYTRGNISKIESENNTVWYSYDYLGHLKWTISHTPVTDDYYYTEFDFDQSGKLIATRFEPQDYTESFFHYYQYDANQRLKRVLTSREPGSGNTSSHAEEQIEYVYSVLGQVIREELGDNLQGLDYVYMINGSLKSMNTPEPTRDPGKDGFSGGNHENFKQDAFGFTLDYYENDYRRNNSAIQSHVTMGAGYQAVNNDYDGTIKSMRWRVNDALNFGELAELDHSGQQLMYKYQYDDMNNLIQADFAIISDAGTQNMNGDASRIKSPVASYLDDYQVSNLVHDLNGNILSLNRNGVSSETLQMDQLVYHYQLDDEGNVTNKLDYVEDLILESSYPDDFETQQPGNYLYDLTGKVIGDVEAGNYFEYYHSGLVKAIYRDVDKTSPITSFQYDESGSRMFKYSYDENGELIRAVNYVRDGVGTLVRQLEFGFENDEFITLGDDFQVGGGSQVGYYDNLTQNYSYNIIDHLGNVRMVISDQEDDEGNVIVIEANDYYPFGLNLKGREYTSGGTQNMEKGFQGQETDPEVGLVSFPLRQYNPSLGKWLTPDPYNQHVSPYTAMNNNPVSFIDPTGGQDYYIDGIWVSANMANSYIEGVGFENVEITGVHKFVLNEEMLEDYYEQLINQLETSLLELQIEKDFEYAMLIIEDNLMRFGRKLKAEIQIYTMSDGTHVYSGVDVVHVRSEHMVGRFTNQWERTTFRLAGSLFDQVVGTTSGEYSQLEKEYVEEFERRNPKKFNLLDWVQGGLDIIGYFDPTGIADVLNAGISFGRGNFKEGFINLTSAFPGGDVAKAAKYADKAAGIIKSSQKVKKGASIGCFIAGTEVLRDDGMVSIEDVSIGDHVWSYNQITDQMELKLVEQTFIIQNVTELVRVETGGELILSTPDHPFYVKGEWVEAKDLQSGDVLTCFDSGRSDTVGSVNSVDTLVTVYNFRVQDNANYFISESSILVHNNKCPTGGNNVYTPSRKLGNDPRTGKPKIDDEAAGRHHTQLGEKNSSNPSVGTYSTRRTVDANGNVRKQIDYTDHGRPSNHANPHTHQYDKMPNGQYKRRKQGNYSF